ncbi:GNAT family N-acetyltransferase [Geodermatophilus sp. DSM 45219]|uniref:GNAT family N-acetyltransferase n=1 Tax=Geodermatophilus sp. DSM 45219 TaxID=1881103 RepID=UPI000889F101|nr:GNAT family N-acetyltransferase [Geodermatophilus sp. DSM 45219]SDN44899.1 Acetyltransferase involved in cellulose biosynthesis, CelD/BcsL family [Geodermatophilus sp. DSM 45219]
MDGSAPVSERVPGVGAAVEVAAVPGGRTAAVQCAAVVSDHAGFADLAGAWDDLWARSPSATPFQTHAWTSAWARAYVPAGRLAVVTVWDGDALVAAAALHRVRRGPARVLVPLGGQISDSTDVLLDPSVPDAGPRLVAAVLAVPGWRVLDLPEVLPGAAAQQWAQHWPGAVRRAGASLSLELPALPVTEVLSRVPSRTAGTLRRKLRKIERLGVQETEVAPDDVPRAVEDLIRLHEAQWAGRRGNPEHLTERFGAHLADALPRMVRRGEAVVVEYRLDGELVASEVDLVGHTQLAYYLAGISPALREHVDTAVLLVSGALARATRRHVGGYSFLRGEEDYKLRWRPDEVRATRLLLARPGPLGSAGYFSAATAGSTVMALARRALRGRARDLARTVMQGVRTLRARASARA